MVSVMRNEKIYMICSGYQIQFVKVSFVYLPLFWHLLRNWCYCRWSPYGNTKCTICKQQVHQDGKYCHTCAYSKGNEDYFGIAYDLLVELSSKWFISKFSVLSNLKCSSCAGVCAMCGKQVLDTKLYKQSNVWCGHGWWSNFSVISALLS